MKNTPISQYISIKYHLGHALAYWTAGGTAGAEEGI
jgi:iron complex transport system permease protein